MTSLGLLVPCRNEAAVIGRKLQNLALAEWPADGAPHRLIVVDDGSDDGTAERATALFEELFVDGGAVRPSVIANRSRPGKAGAIATGLEELGEEVDLVVLSDADVIVEPASPLALAAAFDADPRLGMACGAQRFVRDLADDGRCLGADGGEPVPAGDRYDRITARVRALESRFGRLFSVHGQLLAWRRELGLVATPGVAADDIELMLQVRRRGLAVRVVPAARFLEVKTPPGGRAKDQALRRARAYVQVVRRGTGLGGGLVDRLQWLFYHRVPTAAPVLGPLLVATAVAVAYLSFGAVGALVASAVAAVLLLSPAGRGAVRLGLVIARAVRAEAAGTMGDRWEMERS